MKDKERKEGEVRGREDNVRKGMFMIYRHNCSFQGMVNQGEVKIMNVALKNIALEFREKK